MPALVAPFPQFYGSTGHPLDGGFVYIGEPNGNPETAPVTVYWDEAQTQPAAQPLRTVRGFIARAGTPAPVYVPGDYSMTVRDRGMAMVAYTPRVAGLTISESGDPGFGGMWPDVTPATTILRLRDRLFVNGGAAFTGNRSGTQGGFVPTSTQGANWAPRDSLLFCASDKGLMAVTGFASNDNLDMTAGEPTETIGVSGFVIGKKAGRSVWGLYSDVQYHDGTSGWGCEFAIKNVSGVDTTATPDFFVSGACGIWLVAGGDPSYGGAPTNPSNFAIGIGGSGGANCTWNKGIIAFEDGLTRDGSGYATALEMSLKHRIVWRNGSNSVAFDIRSEVTSPTGNVAIVANDNVVTVAGTGGASIVQFAHQASAVNRMQILNSAAGAPVQFSAAGSDTDIDVRFVPKGAGVMRFGTHTSNADAPISGYITIKDSGGTVRKLAVIS